MAQENKPTHEIRIDNIRATIWTNVSSTGETWFSVTTCRLYKNDEGKWQESRSFASRDLLSLANTVHAARFWIEDQIALASESASVSQQLVESLSKGGSTKKRREV
jgi:hypothetical protein